MKKRIAIVGAVAALVVVVLWLKPRAAPEMEQASAQSPAVTGESERVPAVATVLLFADPREAESSCGCAEVIRIARGASKVSGVTMREFDTRRRDEQTERYRVRVSPTVIIADPDGTELSRFEGESGQVIVKLRTAVASLGRASQAPRGRRGGAMTEYLSGLLSAGSLVALPVALVAGVMSGLNPCCLPIYPAAAGCRAALRRDTIRGNLGVAAAFVLGGSLMTMTLGIASGLAGSVFGGIGSWPVYVLAAVPFAFGLHLLGAVRISLPAVAAPRRVPRGPVGAAVTGALLGLVITPCATPVLAGLLAYVATTGDPLWGGVLLFVYGLGLGVPILLVGTAAASLVTRLSSDVARRWAEHMTGAVLVGVGLYLVWIA